MDLVEGRSPFKAAKYALIGAVKVSWSDVDFKWPGDLENRELVRSQVENLMKIYESPAGIRRSVRGDRIYCTIDVGLLEAWCAKENISMTPKGEPAIVLGKADEIGEKFICQAGQHRMTALYQLVKKEYAAMKKKTKGLGTDRLSESEYIREHCWWVADIFDPGQIKKWDLEKLRINGTSQVKLDSDRVVWNRLNAFLAYNQDGVTYEEITRHVFKNVAGVIEDVWNGKYRYVVSTLMAYPAYNESFYASAVKVLTAQRISFYWQTYFEKLLRLMEDVTANRPDVLSRASLELLLTLSTPRKEAEVYKLFGIERTGIGEFEIARNGTLLSELTDEEYLSAAQALIEAKRVAIESWASIANRSNGIGKTLNDVCIHICRWINPLSMMEKRHVQGKMSVQGVMADALGGEKNRLIEVGTEDNWLTRIGPYVVPLSDLDIGIGRIQDCVTMGLEDLRKKPNCDWLNIKTLESTNQAIYQQRFVLHPWARVLRTVENVFPTLKHAMVKSISTAQIQIWARATPTLIDAVMTALVKNELVSNNPAIDDKALDELRDILGPDLQRWEQKTLKGYVAGPGRYEDRSTPKDTAWIKARSMALAVVLKTNIESGIEKQRVECKKMEKFESETVFQTQDDNCEQRTVRGGTADPDTPSQDNTEAAPGTIAEGGLLSSGFPSEGVKKQPALEKDSERSKRRRISISSQEPARSASEQQDSNESDGSGYTPPPLPKAHKEPNKAKDKTTSEYPPQKLAFQSRPTPSPNIQIPSSQRINDSYVRPIIRRDKPGGLRTMKKLMDRKRPREGDVFGDSS